MGEQQAETREKSEAAAPDILTRAKLARQAVVQSYEGVDTATSRARQSTDEYEKSLRAELVGKRFLVTGSVSTEEYKGQDGYEWDKSHRYLSEAEAIVDQIFLTNGEWGLSDRRDIPFAYLSLQGTKYSRDKVGVYLLQMRQFELLEAAR